MSCNWLSHIVKGIFGPGLFIICISSLASLVDFYAVNNTGMTRCGEKNPPHLNVSPPLCLVCSMCSICSDPLLDRGTILLLHVFLKFYAVVIICVLTILFQVVKGVFCWIQISPQLRLVAKWFWFCRHVIRIFKLIVACGMRWHHTCIGNQVSVIVSPAMKWYFHVLMAPYDAFTRWMCGGTNWYAISPCRLYFLRLSDASFSSQWAHVMYPLFLRCLTCLVYAYSIWLTDLLLRGSAKIALS